MLGTLDLGGDSASLDFGAGGDNLDVGNPFDENELMRMMLEPVSPSVTVAANHAEKESQKEQFFIENQNATPDVDWATLF